MATFIQVKGKKGISIKAIVRIKGYKTVCKSFSGITLARSWARKVETAMEEGTYTENNRISENGINIEYVSELIDFFKKCEAPVRYGEQATKYDCMFEWWKLHTGHLKIKELRSSHLAECKQILITEIIPQTGKPRKINTINKYLMCLSAVLTYGRDELDLMEYNPMSKVGTLPKPDGRKRFLSVEELVKYLAACKNDSDMIYLFVLLALGTGGRYTEVQTLKVENIDFKNQRVFYIDTKNHTSRAMYIKTDVMDFLKKYLKDNDITSGYIFKGKRKDALPFIRGRLYEIIREVGLENFTVHDMRHTFASYGAMNGASLAELAEMLGQTSTTVTKNYTHLTQKHIDNVVKGFIENIIPKI